MILGEPKSALRKNIEPRYETNPSGYFIVIFSSTELLPLLRLREDRKQVIAPKVRKESKSPVSGGE